MVLCDLPLAGRTPDAGHLLTQGSRVNLLWLIRLLPK